MHQGSPAGALDGPLTSSLPNARPASLTLGGSGSEYSSGKPVFLYNLLDLKRTVWDAELHAGKHTIASDFTSDGPGLGIGGKGVRYVAQVYTTVTTPCLNRDDRAP